MFEDRSYDNILAEVLAKAPSGISLRQGDIFYDSTAAICDKIAQFYADLGMAFDLAFLDTAVDEYLDMNGSEYGVYRNPATSARYKYIFTGSQPSVGERFFVDGEYFALQNDERYGYYLEAESAGIAVNGIFAGTPAVPVNNISGLQTSEFGELLEPGADTEGDEEFRQRIREKIAGPAENGNRQHYKTWCEEVPGAGVGRARIMPLFAGENTVMGIILSADGTPAANPVVERVQEYVDPITLGVQVEYNGEVVTVGDGLGNGVANIGAHFLAKAPDKRGIVVSFTAILRDEKTVQEAVEQATEAITDYLKDLALNTADSEDMVIRLSTIGALIYAMPSIIDYTELMINGESANIEINPTETAVLEGVEINAAV